MSDLALFDFDGTVTTGETFGRFVRAVASPRRLAIGTVLLAPLVAGYRLGLVPGTVARASVVRFALRGLALERCMRRPRTSPGPCCPACCGPKRWTACAGTGRAATPWRWCPAPSTCTWHPGAAATAST